MRNLKRALSLVMAMALIVGMMVVSASAVTTRDFTDSDEIQHTEAVNTMVALNVISGKEDGSYYDPTGSLTRAEMAKVVAYVMNGGVEPVVGTKLTPTYSDIKGHWAEKYIEYCTSMGIINGDGAGKFNPEGTLTAEQCAKMFLTAMGYNANVFGFTGNDWAINVGRYANEAGLYEDLGDVVPSNVISRDDAAQMAYNAIQATMMERTWSQDLATGQVGETYAPWIEGGIPVTLLNQKFNGNIYEGVMVGSSKYAVTVAGKTGAGVANRLSIALQRTNGGTQVTVANATLKNFDCSVDYSSMMGEYVKVIAGKNDTVYGVYSVNDENTVLLNTTTNNVSMDGSQVEVDGTNYDLASTTAVIINGGSSVGTIAATYASAPKAADSIKLISYDGDSSIDLAVVETMAVSQVNYVGSDSFTLTTPFGGTRGVGSGSGNYKSASQKMADVDVYDGIAKDDYVIVTKDLFADKDVVEKIAVTSMTVTGTKGTVGVDAQFMMDDGTWYKYAANMLTTSVSTAEAALKAGDTVDVVTVGNIMFFVAKTSANQGVKNVAYVINAAPSSGANPSDQAYLLYSDGTKEVVNTDGNYSYLNNQLVTFRSTSDGYVLTALANQTAATLGFETVADTTTENVTSTGTLVEKIDNKEIADDAVIVLYPNNSATKTVSKVITGAELKRIALARLDDDTACYATIKANGFEKVAIAVIGVNVSARAVSDSDHFTGAGAAYGYSTNTTNGGWYLGITSGSNYGYLVADAYGTTVNDKDYTNYTMVYNGETVTVREEQTYVSGSFKAGSIVSFDVVSDTEVKNVASAGATVGALSALKDDEVQFVANDGSQTNSGTQKLTNKTVYIYVDTAAKTAASGGSLNMAGSTNGVYVPNVAYVLDGSGNVLLVVVDVNNQYSTATLVQGGATPTAAQINNALSGNDASTTATTIPAGVIIPEGRTLTLNGAVTSWSSLLVRGTLKIADSVTCTSVAGNITGEPGAKVVVGTGSGLTGANNFYATAATSNAGVLTGSAPSAGTTYVWTVWTYTNTSASPNTTLTASGWVAVQ